MGDTPELFNDLAAILEPGEVVTVADDHPNADALAHHPRLVATTSDEAGDTSGRADAGSPASARPRSSSSKSTEA